MSINQSPPFILNNQLHFVSTTHGSASFISESEAIDFGLTEQGEGNKLCPYIGILEKDTLTDNKPNLWLCARKASFRPKHQKPELLDGNGHLLTIAPTRAGKGTGQIIPNLLTWMGSVLVVDIKGENYLLSAGYRETEIKQNVFRFAPFEEESDVWNPIMSIRADPECNMSTSEEEEDARYLINLLISPSGNSGAEFWENSAKNFLEGLILYVRTSSLKSDNSPNDDIFKQSKFFDQKGEGNKEQEEEENGHRKINEVKNETQVRERSMREVRRLLTLKKKMFNALLRVMGESDRILISQAGKCFKGYMKGNGKLGQSILATALEQTAVWAYQRVHKATYKKSEDHLNMEPAPNDFNFSQMRDGNTSIYLIIPPDYLTEYRSILRVMIGFAMRELRTSYKESKKQDKPPVLFILDEFPQLAYMRPIEEALLYLAGYGVRFWFFVQDISQLKLHYKNSWQTFFANTGTQCFFGVSDIETANLVSERAGKTTVQQSTYTYERPTLIKSTDNLFYKSKYDNIFCNFDQYSSTSYENFLNYTPDGQLFIHSKVPPGKSSYLPVQNNYGAISVSDASRHLINPDEVIRIYDDEQIVFIKGLRPIRCYLLNYYNFDELIRRSLIPPPKEVNF